MTPEELIAAALVVAGATIGATLWWLGRGARRLIAAQRALRDEALSCEHDPLALLAAAWPQLARAGVRALRWRYRGYGPAEEGARGSPSARRQRLRRIMLDCGPLSLEVEADLGGLFGERRYFAQAIIEELELLLAAALWRRDALLQASLARLGRLQAMLAHDVKNLAQFIDLLEARLATLAERAGDPTEEIVRLTEAARHAQARALRILRALRQGARADDRPAPEPVALAPLLRQSARLYGIQPEIEGDAPVLAQPEAIEAVIDNLVKNVADAARREGRAARLLARIDRDGEHVELLLEDPGASSPPPLARLFEPFYSTDPDGLGLGLWSARQWARAHGGELAAQVRQGRLRMRLLWPLAAISPPSIPKESPGRRLPGCPV